MRRCRVFCIFAYLALFAFSLCLAMESRAQTPPPPQAPAQVQPQGVAAQPAAPGVPLKPAKKPLIGITAGILAPDVSGGFTGPERYAANADYVAAVVAAGGVPVLLPPVADPAMARLHVEAVDGLLVSGGPDISPLLYKEEPLPATEAVSAERDAYDLAAVKAAAEMNKPVLGICRGIQVMNVAFGGTLYQDVAQKGAVVKHAQKAKRDVATHTLYVAPNTLAATLLKEKTLTVNSFHHQAVKTPAQGFTVSAQAADGIAEAIENPKYRFMLGVQWHPESMQASRPDMLALFKAFVDAARK